MSLRIDKVNRQIMRDLTRIIQREVDDPSVGLISLTKVETSSDLRESNVYFSLLDESKYGYVKNILKKMSKFIRFNLGKMMKIKVIPQLRFIPDHG